MKKKLSWIVYFLVCAMVIVVAIDAGMKHGYCYECEIASGNKNAQAKMTGWGKFIKTTAEKKKDIIATMISSKD